MNRFHVDTAVLQWLQLGKIRMIWVTILWAYFIYSCNGNMCLWVIYVIFANHLYYVLYVPSKHLLFGKYLQSVIWPTSESLMWNSYPGLHSFALTLHCFHNVDCSIILSSPFKLLRNILSTRSAGQQIQQTIRSYAKDSQLPAQYRKHHPRRKLMQLYMWYSFHKSNSSGN